MPIGLSPAVRAGPGGAVVDQSETARFESLARELLHLEAGAEVAG